MNNNNNDIFNQINFSEVNIDPPVICDDKMVVKIHNVELVSGIDTGDISTKYIKAAFLVFSGVVKSTRIISEYIGDPKIDGFKSECTIEDIVFKEGCLKGKKYYEFEGFLTNPLAWIASWVVYCDSFEFQEAYDI